MNSMTQHSPADAGDITELLSDWRNGDAQAPDRLFTLVYHELKRIALRRIAGADARLLDPTELVHEASLRMLGQGVDARSREHFFKVAATAIRCTLIDVMRYQYAEKRGAGEHPVTLRLAADAEAVTGGHWLDVEAAFTELERNDPRKCRIVELALLVGLSQPEIAAALDLSLSTVERDLRFAKAWLRERLTM